MCPEVWSMRWNGTLSSENGPFKKIKHPKYMIVYRSRCFHLLRAVLHYLHTEVDLLVTHCGIIDAESTTRGVHGE